MAAMGGAISYLLGELDGPLIALLIFMSIDYIIGFLCATAKKQLSSKIGFRGFAKKAALLLIVIVAHTVDVHLIGDSSVARTTTIIFLSCNEGVSILENACRIGLPVPQKLKDVLLQLRGDKANKSEDE